MSTEVINKMTSIVNNIVDNERKAEGVAADSSLFRRNMTAFLCDHSAMKEKFEAAGLDMTDWETNYRQALSCVSL